MSALDVLCFVVTSHTAFLAYGIVLGYLWCKAWRKL